MSLSVRKSLILLSISEIEGFFGVDVRQKLLLRCEGLGVRNSVKGEEVELVGVEIK